MVASDSLLLGGVQFRLVGEIGVDRGADGAPLEFMPQAAYAKAATTRLNPHGSGPFCRLRIANGVREAGVYAVVVASDVRYVGIADDLSERWGPRGYAAIHPRNCYVGGQATNCKVNSRILGEIKMGNVPLLYFAALTEGRLAFEGRVCRELRPPWNGRQ
jgi:hypothetical protein